MVDATLLISDDIEVCMIGSAGNEGEVTTDSERIASLFEGLIFVELAVSSGETLTRMWVDLTRAPVELLVTLANGRGENCPVACERMDRREFVNVAVEVNVAYDVTVDGTVDGSVDGTVDGRLFDAILEKIFTYARNLATSLT